MITDPLLLAMGGVAGAALGSYAATAGLRWARAEPSSRGRSHCDACGRTLPFMLTVPVVSYTVCRGRCRDCDAPIDGLHLAGELAGAAIGLGAVAAVDPLRAALIAGVGLLLLTAAVVDWKSGRLPDALTAAVAAGAGALALDRSVETLLIGAIAALGVFAVLQVLRALVRRRRGDPGLGLGDVKLYGALALWLGAVTPWMIAGSAVLGLALAAVTRPVDGRLRFGPAIAAAGWLLGLALELGVSRRVG